VGEAPKTEWEAKTLMEIFGRTEPEILYFRIEPGSLYRHRLLMSTFEIYAGGEWKRTSFSNQDWDHLRSLTEEEAEAIAGSEEALR